MAVVAGIDFGTLSVRVSLFDSVHGRLGSATAGYPIHRKAEDPDHAAQRHDDHMDALVTAMRLALADSDVDGARVVALAVASTASTVLPVDAALRPLDDYYLWCDHRARMEAQEITAAAQRARLAALDWCGGTYSPEAAFAKLLHWLRGNPDKRARFASWIEHADMAVATLCGVRRVADVRRGICAAGHKFMWNAQLGGLPPQDFLAQVDPLLDGMRAKLCGHYGTADHVAGHLCPQWARSLGLRAGIPIPFGIIDAHCDAIGAGISVGDVVNVVGTSTCMMAIVPHGVPIPGVFGVVQGSIHPQYAGVEAGIAAVGDIFDAIARRAGEDLAELSRGLEQFSPGQTGLLRLTWDNGDRNVLANPSLGGVTLGWNLLHTARDELFAAIEGTALHTRIVFERLRAYDVPIRRVILGGGIPQKNDTLNRVYANVLQMPMLVPTGDVTGLGSAIFASLAAGLFETIEAAQEALCPPYRTIHPQPEAMQVYDRLFALYRKLYFSLGSPDSSPLAIGDILPALRQLAAGRHAARVAT